MNFDPVTAILCFKCKITEQFTLYNYVCSLTLMVYILFESVHVLWVPCPSSVSSGRMGCRSLWPAALPVSDWSSRRSSFAWQDPAAFHPENISTILSDMHFIGLRQYEIPEIHIGYDVLLWCSVHQHWHLHPAEGWWLWSFQPARPSAVLCSCDICRPGSQTHWRSAGAGWDPHCYTEVY